MVLTHVSDECGLLFFVVFLLKMTVFLLVGTIGLNIIQNNIYYIIIINMRNQKKP
jgi:hypothetical protein